MNFTLPQPVIAAVHLWQCLFILVNRLADGRRRGQISRMHRCCGVGAYHFNPFYRNFTAVCQHKKSGRRPGFPSCTRVCSRGCPYIAVAPFMQPSPLFVNILKNVKRLIIRGGVSYVPRMRTLSGVLQQPFSAHAIILLHPKNQSYKERFVKMPSAVLLFEVCASVCSHWRVALISCGLLSQPFTADFIFH